MYDLKKQLGRKIQSLRNSKGLSQLEFAEKINISISALGIIETGKGFLTADTLEKILEVLNVQPDELFSFGSVKSEAEIYENILRLLSTIKQDKDKLSKIYSIIKNIL